MKEEVGLNTDKPITNDSLLLNGCNFDSLGYQPASFSTQCNYENSANSLNSNGNGIGAGCSSVGVSSTVCGDCGAVIRNAGNVAVHMRRHLSYKPYTCSTCSYTGYDEDDVRRHASRSHTKGSHVKFKPIADMERQVQDMLTAAKTVAAGGHKTNGHSAKAPVDQSLSVLTNDKVPPALIGPNDGSHQTLLALPSNTDNLTCDLCKGQAVPSHPSAVISHLKCHLNLQSYACSVCPSQHSSWTALSQHMQQAHPQSAVQQLRAALGQAMTALAEVAFSRQPARLECAMCSKSIVWTMAALKAHISEHDGKYPFKCSQCGCGSVDVITAWDHWRKQHLDQFPVLNFQPLFVADQQNNNGMATDVDALNLITVFPLLTPESIESLPADLNPLVEVNINETGGKTVVVEPSGPEDMRDKVACLLCAAGISRSMSCLIAHAKVHLSYKPLKCDYCPFRHFAMSKIRRHNAKVHRGLPVKVSYHPVADIGKQIKAMKLKCFGNLASSCWGREDIMEETPDPDEIVSMDFEEHVSPPSQNGCLSPSDDESSSFNESIQSSLTSPDPKQHSLPPNPSSLFPRGFGHIPPGNMNQVLEQLMRDGMTAGHASSIFPMLANANLMNQMRPVMPMADATKQDSKVVRTGPTATPPVGRATNQSPRPNDRQAATYDLNGMGKKVCLVCNTYIANNPSSFDNHACKHLDYKPYHCYYCQYQSYIRGKVTRHIQQVHNGLPVKIDHKPLPGIKDKIQQIKAKCFPFLMGDGNGNGLATAKPAIAPVNVEETTCQICYASVLTLEGAMDEHLQTHIPVKYYHCPVCTYQTTYLIRAKQHVHSAHPTSQETRIMCCPPEGLQGLQELRGRCFGSKYWPQMEANADRLSYDIDVKNDTYDQMKEANEDSNSDDAMNLKIESEDIEDEEEMQQAKQSDDFKNQDCVTCCVCNGVVSNQAGTMASHVRKHMTDYKPYQCAYCPLKLITEIEVKQHIMATHRHVPLKVEYSPERCELEDMHKACFPAAPPPTLADPPTAQTAATAGRSRYEPSQADLAMQAPAYMAMNNSTAGSTLLKKLICQICKNTIADNAKSVGIHVKNHLNYKPYRCPFCKYMSCEQSKARRHVEHVHNVSGDAVEIHAQPDIKERIKDMKRRCFPALNATDNDDREPDSPDDDNNGEESGDAMLSGGVQCCVCKELLPSEAVDDHCRRHAAALVQYKCDYCTSAFMNEHHVHKHIVSSHPGLPVRYSNPSCDNALQLTIIRSKCFPDLFSDDERSPDKVGYGSDSPKHSVVDGKLTCHVCHQLISMNPNSLEVHAKTHLNFKQHQCGYCAYKSCISGKVKRHLDNVHRGQDVCLLSFTSLSNVIKDLVAETRALCFPQQEGPNYGKPAEMRDRLELVQLVETIRQKLVVEIGNLDPESLDPAEVTAAQASVVIGVMDGEALPVVSSRPPSVITPTEKIAEQVQNEESLDGSSLFLRPGSRAETPSDNGLFNNSGTRVQIQCQLCDQQIADNPSSLGLHVRNHLDYKPFACNLCEYKSPIQAKVKRHLRNVHKCPTDEMSYNPEPDIRSKVTEMKIRCFPRMSMAMTPDGRNLTSSNSGSSPLSMVLEDSPTLIRSGSQGRASAVLDMLLAKKDSSQQQQAAAWNCSPTGLNSIKCRLCSVEVLDDPATKCKHVTSHSSEGQWFCSDCGFSSFIQETVKLHAVSTHQSGAQPVKLDSDADQNILPEEFEKLAKECFPETNNDSGVESASLDGSLNEEDFDDVMDDDECSMDEDTDPNYAFDINKNKKDSVLKCQKCLQCVSLSPSALYVHVKTHMNYKPYTCGHCDYHSHVKSRVRRHICNKHKGQQMIVHYQPAAGFEQEARSMKQECFPDCPARLSVKSVEKVTCMQCRLQVADTPLAKSVHAKNHLDAKPYHCGHCTFRSCVKRECRAHMMQQHSGEQQKMVYVDEEVATEQQVTDTISSCFDTPTMLSMVDAPNAVSALDEGVNPKRIKLGQAYREWHCAYCPFSDTSKYRIKEHCITDHPGLTVTVNDTPARLVAV